MYERLSEWYYFHYHMPFYYCTAGQDANGSKINLIRSDPISDEHLVPRSSILFSSFCVVNFSLSFRSVTGDYAVNSITCNACQSCWYCYKCEHYYFLLIFCVFCLMFNYYADDLCNVYCNKSSDQKSHSKCKHFIFLLLFVF